MRTPPPYRDLSTTLRDLAVAHGDGLAAEELRARVRRALAKFHAPGATRVQARRSERQQTIIARCDLGGELHKVVAGDLGVSMRTLYRDRIEGFARLRQALRAEPIDVPVSVTPDAVAVRIERAWEHVLLGRTREAIVRLEEIAACAAPALLSIAYARLAAARYLAGDSAGCDAAASRAKRALSMLGPGAASTVAEAEINLVAALRLHSEGAFQRALTLYARTAARLARDAKTAVDTARIALHGRIDAHLASGDAALALELAKETCSDAGSVALALAECTLLLVGDAATAHANALAAHATASARSSGAAAARALHIAARASAAAFDAATARSLLREAVATLRDAPDGRHKLAATIEIATALGEMGDGEGGLALTKACSTGRGAGTFLSGLGLRAEAESLLAVGERTDALARAADAAGVLGAFDSRRAWGEALLTQARCEAACGNSGASRTRALQAWRLLQGATWPQRVLIARRLSTGQARRRAFAGTGFADVARAG